MDVMVKTCDVMSDALRAWAAAAKDVRDDLRRLYYEAVLKALPHIDRSDGLDMKDVKSFGKGLLKMGSSFAVGLNCTKPWMRHISVLPRSGPSRRGRSPSVPEL
ncbi:MULTISPECIES: hypothetical protein [Streptomyces]|uniref:hypothetical protein n=1 Tax=Streptomyces TaxID=1883 RepID=UPI0029CD77FF|nr:hypothetical protein [Streptomyces sp. F8]MDX6758717.1 hypothetical protein [Streptomyces sp. F8]